MWITDDNTQHYEAANAETLYVLTSPLRWLFTTVRFIGTMLLIGLLWGGRFVYLHVGGQGISDREAAVEALSDGHESERLFITHDGYFDDANLELSDVRYTTHAIRESADMPFCAAGDYNTDRDSSLPNGKDILRRKSARMGMAIQNGIIMASAMRYMLSAYKDAPSREIAAGRNLCTAAVHHSIDLTGVAPTVSANFFRGTVIGLCLRFSCHTEDDMLDVQTFHDSWNRLIPLTEGQTEAVQRLASLSTDAAWLEAAHQNGISDDARVLRMASQARAFRDSIMFPDGKPRTAEIE